MEKLDLGLDLNSEKLYLDLNLGKCDLDLDLENLNKLNLDLGKIWSRSKLENWEIIDLDWFEWPPKVCSTNSFSGFLLFS